MVTERLKERREALRRRGDKGFTLMEMLVVVAIIAIMVAIAIPIYTTQLARARAATDAANIRAGYADLMSKVLLEEAGLTADADNGDEAEFYLLKDGTVSSSSNTANTYDPFGNYTDLGSASTQSIGGLDVGGSVTWSQDDDKIVYTVRKDENGVIRITKIAGE